MSARNCLNLQSEAREIRTPNLLIWSQTRYRCAIAPMITMFRSFQLEFYFPLVASLPSNGLPLAAWMMGARGGNWLAGGLLAGWQPGWLADWPAGWLAGSWLAGGPASWQAGGWLAGGWLAGWLAGNLVLSWAHRILAAGGRSLQICWRLACWRARVDICICFHK